MFENLTTFSPSTTTPQMTIEMARNLFSWFDYLLFGMMLGVSTLIGIWFGFCGKKEDTTTEYLMGGKTMQVFPVAISLIASAISGTTILGVPAETYLYGDSYWFGSSIIFIVCTIIAYVYLPVFFKLQLTSSYEYLKLRFDYKVRTLASLIAVVNMILFTPIFIYIPSLAFSQVTGANLYFTTVIVCVVCIFYTSIGGIRAVVWTDALQFGCIIGSLLAILFVGIAKSDGFMEVWNEADQGERLDYFTFDIDPTLRNSFWSVMIGLNFLWISNIGVHQAYVQRFLSLPSIKNVKKALVIFALGLYGIHLICGCIGLLIYSKYKDCDPISTKKAERLDQLLPFYVMDVAGHIYGLPGLFIAGVFSAALSTMSGVMNALAAIIYEDYISHLMPEGTTEKTASNIMKIIVVVTGVQGTLFVFVVEKLGGILQLAVGLGGVMAGPTLGLFTLGMLFPSANTKGALCGSLTGMAFATWVMVGNLASVFDGRLIYPTKPLSVNGCSDVWNITALPNMTVSEDDKPFYLYRLSYYYFCFLGLTICILVGLPVSWLTGGRKARVHPDLLSPVVHWTLSKPEPDPTPDFKTMERALEMMNSEEENNLDEGSDLRKYLLGKNKTEHKELNSRVVEVEINAPPLGNNKF